MTALSFPVPSEQPQNVYAGDKTSAIEISLSWQPPPDHAIHGILKGFYIWYSIIQLGIHEKNPVFPQDFRIKQLPAASYQDTLTNLESYARYSIRIAAFTSKGYGPIREISTSKSVNFVILLLGGHKVLRTVLRTHVASKRTLYSHDLAHRWTVGNTRYL